MKEKFYQDISALLENANINNVPIAEVKEQKVEKEEKHIEKLDKKEEVKVQKESEPIEKKQKGDTYLDDVDESAIFGD
ncbi:hypothetical protein ACUIJ5_32210 (plasmid) [Bacillus toyonensis]